MAFCGGESPQNHRVVCERCERIPIVLAGEAEGNASPFPLLLCEIQGASDEGGLCRFNYQQKD